MNCATSSVTYSDGPCPHCGMIHKTTCPRIKAIEYENGMVKRIEFHAPVPVLFGTASHMWDEIDKARKASDS